MGYGRDPSSRLTNGSWPDGARSVAVLWHPQAVTNPETDDPNAYHIGVNTDFNMTSIFEEEVSNVVEAEEVLQMRVGRGEGGELGGREGRGGVASHVPALKSAPLFHDTDPCKASPVQPCGTGVCTKARAPWDPSILVPSCKCPLKLPSFQPSHLAGLPSCFPGEPWTEVGKRRRAVVCCSLTLALFPLCFPDCLSPSLALPKPDSFTCRQFPRNPCAPGVCIDDIDGTYSCLCPSPYFPFYFYPKGAARCYHCAYHMPIRWLLSSWLSSHAPLRLAETRMPTFLSPYGLTCALILNTYGLTQADFFSQNKGFQCRAPIPVGTLVNVTSRAFSQCTAMYTANYGDTCDSLNALFSTQIQPLNPALTCSDGPRPGQLLCVSLNQTWLEEGMTRISCKLQAQITPAVTQTPPTTSPSPQPPPPPPPLANYTSVGVLVTVLQGPQTCQQLWRAFAIASPTRFFQMNPGLSCDSLLPHSPLQGNMMRRPPQIAWLAWPSHTQAPPAKRPCRPHIWPLSIRLPVPASLSLSSIPVSVGCWCVPLPVPAASLPVCLPFTLCP
ncbi:unnamed protein product [Closterium sp. NIES-65]|nr:unnamed protein product [Closterium sp. NIES-65]CAI5984059.1 unnamed protein product [Closterium sp. NIES-65]